jgi:hypothetical protein
LVGSNFPGRSFRIPCRGRGGHESRLGCLCLVDFLAAVPDGGGCSFLTIRYFVHHHPDCDATFTQIFRRMISMRYRVAVYALSFLAPRQRQSLVRMRESRAMKNEKLKSTTVRFTDSDLHLIECLQEKLGLGMIHVVRLAIRRLAESENLLPLPSPQEAARAGP